jgi:hypothetical protein
VALVAAGASAFAVFRAEQQIADLRSAGRVFDLRAREVSDALVDLRVAQAAYVASTEGSGFWMPQASSALDGAVATVELLRLSATNVDARTALDEIARTVVDFASADERARAYIEAAQPLMAADVIFTDGITLVGVARRQIQAARTAELLQIDAAEAGLRRRQAATLGVAAGIVALATLLLVPLPRRRHAAATDRDVQPPQAPASGLSLRDAAPPILEPAGAPLEAAAELCTEFGRARDAAEMRPLLGRAADLMHAGGVVVWVASADGAELRPALAFGYSAPVLARMSSVPRTADNAAAAAFRTGQLQVVSAGPGLATGAVVAPLLSAEGCIGAFSAEVRDGGETAEAVRALAAIFAAQFAASFRAPAVAKLKAQG